MALRSRFSLVNWSNETNFSSSWRILQNLKQNFSSKLTINLKCDQNHMRQIFLEGLVCFLVSCRIEKIKWGLSLECFRYVSNLWNKVPKKWKILYILLKFEGEFFLPPHIQKSSNFTAGSLEKTHNNNIAWICFIFLAVCIAAFYLRSYRSRLRVLLYIKCK